MKKHIHCNEHLQKAWNRYGENNFSFSILKICNVCELNDWESYYITLYQTLNYNYGYNIVPGGNINHKLSEDMKRKIGEGRKGKLHSEQTKERMSKTRQGSANSFYGKHHTEEAKQKMHEKHYDASGKNNPRFNPEPVFCVETQTVYPSAFSAAQILNLYSSSIRKCCLEKLQTTGGYHFKFYLNQK